MCLQYRAARKVFLDKLSEICDTAAIHPQEGKHLCKLETYPSEKVSFCLEGTKGWETGFKALPFPVGVEAWGLSESWLLLPDLPFPGVAVSGVGGQSVPSPNIPDQCFDDEIYN